MGENKYAVSIYRPQIKFQKKRNKYLKTTCVTTLKDIPKKRRICIFASLLFCAIISETGIKR